MRGFGQFLKTTLLGGFFVLLPLAVVLGAVVKGVLMVKKVSVPIANLFPKALMDQPHFPVLLAGFLFAMLCFACGLLMRFALIRAAGGRIERAILWRLPGYRALKGLTRGLGGSSEAGAFKPVLLVSPDGYREFAFLIEDNGTGDATVMIPGSPAAMSGAVRIVRRELIEPMDASLTEVAGVLGQFGVGAQALLAKSAKHTSTGNIGKDS